MIVPVRIASAISNFCCCGISCQDCVFNTDGCSFYEYVPDAEEEDKTVEINDEIFKFIASNKEYFEKCKAINKAEWEVLKRFFRGGASLG